MEISPSLLMCLLIFSLMFLEEQKFLTLIKFIFKENVLSKFFILKVDLDGQKNCKSNMETFLRSPPFLMVSHILHQPGVYLCHDECTSAYTIS